jgi:purine nucleoside permease
MLSACLLLCLIVLFVGMPSLPHVQAQARATHTFRVKVFIITMFAAEAQHWLENETWPLTFTSPGADNVIHCKREGQCLTITGVDKVNAATSMMAILRDPQFSFRQTYFLTAGTASTSPDRGTLGSTAWARWVVDWDQGFHLLPATVPDIPFGYIAPSTTFPDSTAVFQLNKTLVQLAYRLTAHLKLQDSAAANAERHLYPELARQHPSVVRCDTIAGDNIWVGHKLSQEAQYITGMLTKGEGHNCTYEQEDTAVAGALQRTGHLDHYLSLRAPSAFDQPHPGQSVQEFINAHFRANDIATANLYKVGSTVAHYLLEHKTFS